MQPRHRASGKEWSRKWGNGGRTGTGSGPQALRPQYTALVYITNHGAWPRVSKASQESRPGPALAYRREGERLGSQETQFASWPQPDRNPQENAPLPLHALPPASWALSHKPCALASPSHPPQPVLARPSDTQLRLPPPWLSRSSSDPTGLPLLSGHRVSSGNPGGHCAVQPEAGPAHLTSGQRSRKVRGAWGLLTRSPGHGS